MQCCLYRTIHNAGQSLISALKHNTELDVALDDHSLADTVEQKTYQVSGRLADSKIAICGLAGRFPNAADHEAF